MPKKTTILIIILAVITAALIVVAITSETTQKLLPLPNNNNEQAQQTTEAPTPQASLLFEPSGLTVSNNQLQTVNIGINTSNMGAFGAQVELQYDPRVITNVNITPSQNNFFGTNPTVILDTVDQSQGRASFAISTDLNGSDKTGTGSFATLTFNANPFAGVASTQITFLPKSTVTSLQYPDYSLLKDTTSLSISLSGSPAAQIIQPTISQ